MSERIAVYPGSFDPPTNGHLDLIQRATRMFDHLIVAVTENDTKECLFTVAERIEMLKLITQDLPRVKVTAFTGLTADFARTQRAMALVRGLRVISDFEFELSMAITNQRLNPDIDTVCLMPSEPFLFLSSRLVKEVARFGGDTSSFVPPEVNARLHKKIGKE
jgi:pantetheine-phosphate adenylyltransferase